MNRREYNKQETVRHIRDTFMRLYAQNGIHGVTVNSLCQACGIAKSTFYLYFDDKYQVLESVETELLATLHDIAHDLSDCDMNEVLTGKPLAKAISLVALLQEKGDIFRALLGKNGDPRFRYKWTKDIMDSFTARFRAEKGDVTSAGIASTIFSSSLIGLYTHYLFDMPNITAQELAIVMGNLLKYSLYDFQTVTK